MSSQIRYCICTFGRQGVAVEVELFLDKAPSSSRFLTSLLPIEADIFNSKWNGAELFTVLPPMNPSVVENQSESVRRGDVVMFHWPTGHRGMPNRPRAGAIGAHTELGFYYGELIRAYSPAGPATGTLVGQIVQGLDDLAEVAQTMRRAGFGRLKIVPRP